MSQNLMQSQKPNRRSGGRGARAAQARTPLAIWQRLSIRTKLLVPLALALVVTLVILLARFTPSVNEFAVNRTRVEFTTRLNDLNVQISTLFSESRQVFVQLLADEGSANAILYQVSTDAGGKGLAVATLSTQLQEKMTNLAVPLLDVRYLDKEGKPIVHVVQIPSGDQRRPSPLRPDQFVEEGGEDYFKIIKAIPEGQAYITPARLIKVTAEAEAEPVVQIGMPIYQGNEFYGVVIGRLGIRAFLTTLFQPFETSQLSAGLVDPTGSVLASVVAGSSGANPPASTVAILGDSAAQAMPIPAELLTLTDQDLRDIQGQLYSTRLIDIPGVIQSPYRMIVSQSADTAFADARALSTGITLTLSFLFLVVLGCVALISNSVTRPLVRLSQAAGRLSERDLEVEIPTLGGDEVGQLAGALDTMRGHLATTLNSLETRVAERTRNLEIAAEISRDAAQLRDTDELLQRTVNAIRERFNFYHAQVFLLDEAGEYAVLHTSTGEAGQKLLEMKHKLAVGSESIVGQTTGLGRTFITLDTQSSAVPHRFNVLLPLTRSEIALPLRSGVKVIGALDIQSVEPNAFGENETQIFQVLADQIAIAIDNARLLQESDTRLRQVAALNRQLTRGSWTNFLEEGGGESLAFQYDLTEVTQTDSSQDGQGEQAGNVSVDITVRGETVGNLSVSEDLGTKLTDDDRLVLQAVADRVSLAIENARLIEQSVVAASRIQQLYEASRTLGNAVDLSEVYRIATEYLSAYDLLDSLNVLLARPEPIPRPKFLEYVYMWERKPRPGSPFRTEGWVSSENVPLENLLPDARVARIAEIETDFAGYDQAYQAIMALGVQSLFVTPLATFNHWFGFIIFQSERPRAFTQAFVQFASTISDQISTALDNRRLFVNVEAEARRSRALAEAAQVSSQVGVDFETGIANLFAAVAGPAEFDRWWFGHLRFQDTNLVLERVTAQFDPGSPLDDLSPIYLATANNAIAEAARLGQMVVVNDPSDHYVLQNLDRETALAFGKHIALPIRVGPNMVGAMMVGRSLEQADLDERDIQLVTTLTNQIAVVSENRRLFANAENERQTLEQVLNSLPTGVIVTDAKTGEMTLTNELVRTLLGLEREQAYERMHTSSGTLYEDDEFPPIRVVRTGESVYAEDMTVLDASGTRTDLIVNAAPIFDAGGNLVSAVAVFQDVSELRELENVLQESLRETTSLYEISRAIAAENELTSILGVVAAQIVGVISYSHMFAIFRDEGGLPSQTYVARLKEGWRVTELDECPLPMAILPLNENLVENDIAHNPDLSSDPQLRELGIGSVAVFPLNARGHQVGWLVTCTSHQHTFTSEERRFLTTLSDRAAVAVENARLAQQTTDALSETKLLYEASFAINRAVSIENTLEIMREQVKAFAPSQIDVFLVMPRQETSEIDWVMHWVVGDPATHEEIRLIDAPIIDDAQIIESDPYFIENVAMSSLQDIRLLRRLAQWEAVVAQASVPLNVAGRSTGRLIVSFNRPYKFGRVERQFLTTIADQAAIVINNSMLVQQTQDSLEETGTLYQSSRAISDAPDLQGVLNAIIDHAVPPQVNWAMIVRLLSSDWDVPGALVEVAANWERVETYDMTGLRFDPNSFPAWEQAAQPEMLWVNDLTTEASGSMVNAATRAFYENLGLQAVVAVPLTASGQPIGALMLGANEPWLRTERETRIYTSLADQVAISIENRSLLDQTQRRARQLQTSAQVAQAASSILDLEELLNRTVNLIKDSFLYDHVQIFLVSIDNRDAQLVASTGEAGKQLLSIHHSLPVGSMSVIGLTTATGVPQLAADTADARVVHRPNPYLPNTRSELALPLIAKGRVLGALDVQSNRPNAFSQEDQSVLANLSDQVAIAIDNARLFELSTNRVEEMRFLFDVTRTATSVGEMEEAVKQVSDLILGHLKAATTSIFVLDDTNTQFIRYTSELSASLGNTPTSFELENPIFKEVLAMKQPEIVHETTAHPYWQRFPEVRSGILMPLLSGDDLVGILAISMRERNAFTADTTQLLQTMTSTLAAIIQSARLLQQVQAANVRLREVDKLKSQFLANMSHELRTPLNSIIGFSRVILKGIDGPLTTMQEQDLGTIHESGKHLLNLVNDILDQAKIEAGKMELSYSFFSVVDLLKSVMSTAVGLVKDKAVRLHQEIENELPQAWGDEFRSRQVLLNLVSNAAKFTAQGSVTVSAFLIEEEGTRMVQVSVTDTGIGIPQDKLESVFEAFQQVENTTARQYEGTGLGLPIAKSLIQMQGGRIWVDSEPGVGSTFSFTLPIEQPEVPEAEQAQPEGDAKSEVPVEVNAELENQVVEAIEHAETPKTTQRIILAIDDELSMVNLYRRYLIRSGYEVIGAAAEEAEELAITYQPRVILLDVNMPNRSGWDVLAKLKDRDETFEIPVIVCTVEGDRERAFRLGAAEFLMKSIDEQTLVQTVRRVELERDRRKVLIIDDQPESIRLIRDALIADERFSVIDALGGEQGIDMVNNHWPDLIILDLRMPGVDGITVYEHLRAYPDTASIPLIVVTADDITDEERQRLNGVLIYQKQAIDSADLLNNVVSQLTW